MSFNLQIFRQYAQKSSPSTSIPHAIFFSETTKSLAIFDAFPKSTFHFLILPRVLAAASSAPTTKQLSDLRSLLQCEKAVARGVLQEMADHAKTLRVAIEEEMIDRYGFVWGIQTGFHGAPSMQHLHLHVLSNDLVSDRLKNKKHYNSFHPKLGFFVDIQDVLGRFDSDNFEEMAQLKETTYEPILKKDLACWRCEKSMKNMPTLKEHLQQEWDNEGKREKAKIASTLKATADDPIVVDDIVEEAEPPVAEDPGSDTASETASEDE